MQFPSGLGYADSSYTEIGVTPVTVTLSSDEAQIVSSQISSGKFSSPEQVVKHALRMFSILMSDASLGASLSEAPSVKQVFEAVSRTTNLPADVSTKDLINEGRLL